MPLRLIKSVTLSVIVLASMGCQNTTRSEFTQRWWSVQKAPAGVVKTVPNEDFESISAPEGKVNTSRPVHRDHIFSKIDGA